VKKELIEELSGKTVDLEQAAMILTTLAEAWASACEEMEAFGIGNALDGSLEMQVRENWFTEHFTRHTVNSAWSNENKELSVILRGVKVFCLVEKPMIKEEAKEICDE
jgi:hypothetical protein